MTGRILTRAGRKIRHVAPWHVVDVATGTEIKYGTFSPYGRFWRVCGVPAFTEVGFHRRIEAVLEDVARAEAACTLVAACLWIGGAQ